MSLKFTFRPALVLGIALIATQLSAQPPASSAPYGKRVVAYIYGDVPITREDLGEFLIERYGAEKVQLLVNKLIIEHACQRRGLTVTRDEIDAALAQDLKDLGVNKRDFIKVVLKNYGKTLYEWENDVIKPRLLMGKLIRDQISVSEEDLKKMFEHLYGEKVRGRIIMWQPSELRIAQRKYGEIRETEEAFAREARNQFNPTLAQSGGQVTVAKHSLGQNNLLEKEAFALHEGEVSRILSTQEGHIVFKCDGRIPADATKDFEKER